MRDVLNPWDLSELERGGAVKREGNRLLVDVLIHDPSDLKRVAYAQRKPFLTSRFLQIAEATGLSDITFDFQKLSVAGQSVVASLPYDACEDLVRRLEVAGVEVAPSVRLQAVVGP